MIVLSSARVHAAIEAARLADLQGANALVGELTKLGVVTDHHLVLQPFDLRLREKNVNEPLSSHKFRM